MDPPRLRKRVIQRLLVSPWVVVPAGLGAASLLLGLVMGQPAGYMSFLGVTGVLLGLGMAATRWFVGFQEITRQAFEDLCAESGVASHAYLERLKQRIRSDSDPRTARLLKDLAHLSERMVHAGVLGLSVGHNLLPEIRDKAVELYRHCLASLERTVELFEAAGEMATTEARRRLLSEREELLDEVGRSVAHLGATLDHFRTSQLKRRQPAESLARMREELSMGLEVAQRVDRRMESFDRELGPCRTTEESDGELPPIRE